MRFVIRCNFTKIALSLTLIPLFVPILLLFGIISCWFFDSLDRKKFHKKYIFVWTDWVYSLLKTYRCKIIWRTLMIHWHRFIFCVNWCWMAWNRKTRSTHTHKQFVLMLLAIKRSINIHRLYLIILPMGAIGKFFFFFYSSALNRR